MTTNPRGQAMLERIMVPLDGSDFARQALPRAVSLARRADATLLLVRVHRGFPPAEPGQAPRSLVESDRELVRSEKEELSRSASALRDRGLDVEMSFEEGPVDDALVRRAERAADLVVMSTHGRGGFSRFWLGSVADALARRCSTPLFFIRPGEAGAGEAGAGEQEAPDLRHVLVPLDGSKRASRALETATEVGELYDVRYTLVRVVQPAMLPGYDPGDLPEGVDPEAISVMEETAAAHLERAAADLRERGFEVERRVVRHASVSEALLDAAAEGDVDLVAMATHGRGGVERLVLGSVADKMLRAAPCSVLLRRPEGGD